MRSHQTWTWGTWGICPQLQMKVNFFNNYFTTKLTQTGVTLCCENVIGILWEFLIFRRDNVKCLYVQCYKVCNSFSNGSAQWSKHVNSKWENGRKSKPYKILTIDYFRWSVHECLYFLIFFEKEINLTTCCQWLYGFFGVDFLLWHSPWQTFILKQK